MHDDKLVLGDVLEHAPLSLLIVARPAYPIVGLEGAEQGVAVAGLHDVAKGDIGPGCCVLMAEDLLHWVVQAIAWRVHDGATDGCEDSSNGLSERGGHIGVRYIASE